MIYKKHEHVPGPAECPVHRSPRVTGLLALTTCQAGCSDLAGQLWVSHRGKEDSGPCGPRVLEISGLPANPDFQR